MSTQTLQYYEIVSQLPEDTVITFRNVGWEEYEDLLEQVGEASGLRISFDDGTLKVMTLSSKHKKYERFLEALITAVRLRLRINILSFGSATMRKRKKKKGNEPDACFYVQTADVIGHRINIDFEIDPPPDVAVEIDVHHDSRDKFSIYAGLGVPEIWRFDEQRLTIHVLEQDRYEEVPASRALPMVTSQILTEFLTSLPEKGEFQTLIAFDEWLQTQRS
ncbi:MAG: Uma2 family endonuclease [Acidobacteriota bacterium]